MSGKRAIKTFSILLAGAGIGAATGLLYAPQDGKRTRRDLRRFAARRWDQIQDLQHGVTVFFGETVNSMDSCIAETRKFVDQTRHSASHAVADLHGSIQNSMERMKQRWRSAS